MYLQLNGEANPDEKYRVQIGKDSYVVTGQQLTKEKIGPFTVPANEITPFTITLDEPAYATKDIELKFESAYITSIDG